MAQQNMSSEFSQPMMNEGEIRYPLSEAGEFPMPTDQGSPANTRWIYSGRPLAGPMQEENGEEFIEMSPQQRFENETMPMAPTMNLPMKQTMSGSMPIQGMNGSFAGGVSSDFAQSQRMRNPVDMSAVNMPPDSREAYLASMRSLLSRNIGFFVVCTFLMGNGQSVTWQGILHTVGSDYLVLYQPDYERYISCDLYSLKFTQFHNARGVPYAAASRSWEGQRSW